jgi:hypothetical protein
LRAKIEGCPAQTDKAIQIRQFDCCANAMVSAASNAPILLKVAEGSEEY